MGTPAHSEHRGTRTLVLLACTVILIGGLKAAAEILTPFLVALFLSVLCIPPMSRLQKYGVPRGLAITTVVVGATFAVLFITIIVGRSLGEFDHRLPEYRAALDAHLESGLVWLQNKGIDISTEELSRKMDSGALLSLIGAVADELLRALSQVFLVVLTMIFMLVETSILPAKLRNALGDPNADLSDYLKATEKVQEYVAIKAAVSLGTAVLAAILTASLGIDFPLLWALLAFLFNFVPNIGSIIAAIPPVLLAVVQFGGGRALAVALGYLVINLIMGNVVEPRWMGRKLGLSTLVVFLSLIFWNWVWGPVGMLLSVPLTVIVKILLEHSEDFRGIAVFLGGEEAAERPSSQ